MTELAAFKNEGMPEWFEAYTKEPEGAPLDVTGFGWILSRPEAVQKLVLRFPPRCVVRVLETCPTCSGKGCEACGLRGRVQESVGIVYSIVAGDSSFPTLKVVFEPDSQAGVEHMPDDLEVVGYWRGITPEVVESVLAMKAMIPTEVRESGKLPRNEACPCGSGRKWKKCCGGPKGLVQA